MTKLGIADTMFARADMAGFALKAIEDSGETVNIERYTVPGIKDLPLASKRLIEENDCDIVLALGMPGAEKIDKQCADQASNGIINAQLITNKHIIEVFVHADEVDPNNHDYKKKLLEIVKDRTIKHTLNALALIKNNTKLSKYAGFGKRQGHADAGPLR